MRIRDLIFQHAPSPDVISRGLALYQQGAVRQFRWEEKNEETFLSADIAEHKPIVLLKDGALTWSMCSCSTDPSLCVHRVALLRAADDAEQPQRHVSEQALKAGEKVLGALRAKASIPYVHLTPQFTYEPWRSGFLLSFTLRAHGNGRPFLIKHLSDFAKHVQSGEVVTYGKSLSLSHPRASFDADSLFWVDLITSADALCRYGAGVLQQSPSLGRYIPLSPQQFDGIFSNHIGKSFLLDGSAVQYSDAPPPLIFRMQSQGSGAWLHVDGELGLSVVGSKTQYVWLKDKLFSLPTRHASFLGTLLQCLRDGGGSLYLSSEGIKAFFSHAEQMLRTYFTLEVDSQLEAKLSKAPLHIKARFDEPQPDCLRGWVEFSYGDISFNPLVDDPEIPRREREKEGVFLAHLQSYRFSKNEDEWLLVGQDAMYRFLAEGLEALTELATIEVDKRLLKQAPKPLGKVHIETAITHGMLDVTFRPERFPKEELLAIVRAFRSGRQWVRLKSGDFVTLENLEDVASLAEEVGLNDAGKGQLETVRAPMLQALFEHADIDAAWTSDAQKLIATFDAPIPPYALPQHLKAELRPYQLEGYRWLCHRATIGFGGILADDMGLGKTVQTLAFLLHFIEKHPRVQHLIVAPTSLLYNWAEEAAQFTPSLPVVVVDGNAEERRKKITAAPESAVLIVSYTVLRRDLKHFEEKKFGVVVADEAQNIKNSHTKNAQALYRLSTLCPVALTGTPMENALSDVWSLMHFVAPGYLPNRERFYRIYELPIARYEDEERLESLRRLVTPFLLRRTKDDVLKDLPDKNEHTIKLSFSPEEARIYEVQLALAQRAFIEELKSGGLNEHRIRLLALLMRLRQVCCSPTLLDGFYQGEETKLHYAIKLIKERVQKGHAVVLFSQFTTLLARLERLLKEEGLDYYILTGKTPSNERLRMAESFNRGDVPIFLVSLKAGGVGLNLIGADTVIHYDPWWNQSAENQATDRTYRIGQNNNVTVFRLIMADTIEENMLLLKAKKEALSQSLLEKDASFANITEDDLRELFSIDALY